MFRGQDGSGEFERVVGDGARFVVVFPYPREMGGEVAQVGGHRDVVFPGAQPFLEPPVVSSDEDRDATASKDPSAVCRDAVAVDVEGDFVVAKLVDGGVAAEPFGLGVGVDDGSGV